MMLGGMKPPLTTSGVAPIRVSDGEECVQIAPVPTWGRES